MNRFFFALFALTFASAGFASGKDGLSSQPSQAQATLSIASGSVMTVQDNSYKRAENGRVVFAGESFMVSDNSVVFVLFPSGCRQEFRGPNVYRVPQECMPMLDQGSSAGGQTKGSVSIVAGAALIGGAILRSMDNQPPPLPVSAGAR